MTDTLADRAVGAGVPALDAPDPELDADAADAKAQAEKWEALNPCQVCEAHQNEAPEGEARTALHCWRCGYRPGQTVGIDVVRPALSPQAITDALKQLRAEVVSDILEALKGGQVPAVEITPATDLPRQPAPSVPVTPTVPES